MSAEDLATAGDEMPDKNNSNGRVLTTFDGTWTLIGDPICVKTGRRTRWTYTKARAAGKTYYQGENVLLLSDDDANPFVGHVNYFFYQAESQQVCMSNNWFYRGEEVLQDSRNSKYGLDAKREVLYSSMRDDNPCASILRVVQIVPSPDDLHKTFPSPPRGASSASQQQGRSQDDFFYCRFQYLRDKRNNWRIVPLTDTLRENLFALKPVEAPGAVRPEASSSGAATTASDPYSKSLEQFLTDENSKPESIDLIQNPKPQPSKRKAKELAVGGPDVRRAKMQKTTKTLLPDHRELTKRYPKNSQFLFLLPPNKEWGLELEIVKDEVVVVGVHASKIAALRGMKKNDVVAFLHGKKVDLGMETLDGVYMQIMDLKRQNKTISIQIYRRKRQNAFPPIGTAAPEFPTVSAGIRKHALMANSANDAEKEVDPEEDPAETAALQPRVGADYQAVIPPVGAPRLPAKPFAPAVPRVGDYILPFPNPDKCEEANITIGPGTLVWLNRGEIDGALNPHDSGFIQRHVLLPVFLLGRLSVGSNSYQDALKNARAYEDAGETKFKVKTLDGYTLEGITKIHGFVHKKFISANGTCPTDNALYTVECPLTEEDVKSVFSILGKKNCIAKLAKKIPYLKDCALQIMNVLQPYIMTNMHSGSSENSRTWLTVPPMVVNHGKSRYGRARTRTIPREVQQEQQDLWDSAKRKKTGKDDDSDDEEHPSYRDYSRSTRHQTTLYHVLQHGELPKENDVHSGEIPTRYNQKLNGVVRHLPATNDHVHLHDFKCRNLFWTSKQILKSYSGTKGIIVGFHQPLADRDLIGEVFIKSFKDGKIVAWNWDALEWVGSPSMEDEGVYLVFRLKLDVPAPVYKKFIRLLTTATRMANNLSTQRKISEYSVVQEEVVQLARTNSPHFDKILRFFPSLR
jgi:hypothetical protein